MEEFIIAASIAAKTHHTKANGMTHVLYLELLLLTADPNGKAAVNLASRAQETMSPELRRTWERSMRRHFVPAVPEGKMFCTRSFWAQFEAKRIWRKAWEGTEEQKDAAAAWLRERREDYVRWECFPPAPTFRPAVTLPEPRDGRDGANSWQPRTGK